MEERIRHLASLTVGAFVIWGLTPNLRAQVCQVPKKPQVIVCEAGGEFLCVNTPPGGVKEDFIILKGRLNFKIATFTHLSLVTQHAYTKKLEKINLGDPARQESCWDYDFSKGIYCLGKEGTFSIKAPLKELGPYTFYIAAAKREGPAEGKKVRGSRVIRPEVKEENVTFEPDIRLGPPSKETANLQIAIDLLKGCSGPCDFIGASTGGMAVTAVNLVKGEPPRRIECETNVAQGKPARFAIGIPILEGENELFLTVCNAATGFDKESCPHLGFYRFQVSRSPTEKISEPRIEILSPDPQGPLLFDKNLMTEIPIRFLVPGMSVDPQSCGQGVKISFNDEAPATLCPTAAGIFETRRKPREGLNHILLEIEANGKRHWEQIAFGWGALKTGRLPEAAKVWLSKSLLTHQTLPHINDFLASEESKKWVGDLVDEMGRRPRGEEKSEGMTRSPACDDEGTLKNFRIKIITPPTWDSAQISSLKLEENTVKLYFDSENLTTSLQLFLDQDGNGVPDEDPIPLKIAFKKLHLEPILKTNSEKNPWEAVSPWTDCDFKDKKYCHNLVALLNPYHFEGGATRSGGFVVCDTSQTISPRMEKICGAINNVNNQTGLLADIVLEALNKKYSCEMAPRLSKMMQEGIPVAGMNIAFASSQIRSDGVILSADIDFQESLPVVTFSPDSPSFLTGAKEGEAAIQIKMDALHRASFALLKNLSDSSKSRFEIYLDRIRAKKLGMDFERCEELKKSGSTDIPVWCHLWPRAQELLGTPITEYGYLESLHPLLIVVKNDPKKPPYLKILDGKTDTVQLDLSGWTIDIYALKVDPSKPKDPYGNPAPLLSENGLPIVLSLNPLDPDPLAGPIVSVEAGLTLNIHFNRIRENTFDPNSWILSFNVLKEGSKWWITPRRGGNFTIVPSTLLVANLKDKFDLALSLFSQESGTQGSETPGSETPGKTIEIKIPKTIVVADPWEDSFFVKLGMNKLAWGPEGLTFQSDSTLQVIEFAGRLVIDNQGVNR